MTLLSGTGQNIVGLGVFVIASLGTSVLVSNVLGPTALGVVTLTTQFAFVGGAGTRFGTHVLTDSPGVRWRLGKRSGTGRSNLVLRAPQQPGRYTLTVGVGDHQAQAVVVVEPGP